MKTGESYIGLLDKGEEIYTIIQDKGGKIKVNNLLKESWIFGLEVFR